jgi:hypothetical protein
MDWSLLQQIPWSMFKRTTVEEMLAEVGGI